jgi:hypothetical protein
MPNRQTNPVLRYIRTAAAEGSALDPPDRDLLERFTSCHDEAAFAALVRRHGPMVFRLCRRVLNHQQDAEDAFQATFLVLSREAGSLRPRVSLGGWLYCVAYRIAQKARVSAARRSRHEGRAIAKPVADPLAQMTGCGSDWAPAASPFRGRWSPPCSTKGRPRRPFPPL